MSLRRLVALLFLSSCLAACSAQQVPIAPSFNSPVAIAPEERPIGTDYHPIYAFGSIPSDGEYPDAGLIASGGVLYGTTSDGGLHFSGTIYKVNPAGKETILHNFDFVNGGGWFPRSELYALNGSFYGTTELGGAHNEGTIFRLGPDGKLATLHSFGASPHDGTHPFAGLVAVGGVLYGTTAFGGTGNAGTVYSVRLPKSERVLHSFSQTDGAFPHASLIVVRNALYGVAAEGGSNNLGVVFRMDVQGKETILHSFGGSDGATPLGALLEFGGALYGTTEFGGTDDRGTVFQVSPANTEKVLYSFTGGIKGCAPTSGLVQTNGSFYGVTFGSSSKCKGYGTIFRISPDGNFDQLYQFKGGMAASGPLGRLHLFNNKLYGTTDFGGAHSAGVVFSINP